MVAAVTKLTTRQRRIVFRDVIAAQDGGVSVRESREAVGGRHGVTPAVVRAVEEEGIDRNWPPLEEEIYAERVWKSDGAVNVMDIGAAAQNLRLNASDPAVRLLSAHEIRRKLLRGVEIETDKATFRMLGQSS